MDYERFAHLYDGLVTGGTDIPYFVRLAETAGGPVLELMAGTGRVSIPIAETGVEITCVDRSPAMCGILRRKLAARGLTARVVEQDVTALDLGGEFSLAFIAFNSFEEILEDGARDAALRGVARHLVPGGRFVCTLHDPEERLRDVGPGRERRIPFRDPATGRALELVLTSALDPDGRTVRGLERFLDPESRETLLDVPLAFRLTPREEFEGLARACGFRVVSLHGDYDGSPSMIWTLEKPSGG